MIRTFSNEYRHENVMKMTEGPFDLLVIGGGITGAGIALDASIRGLKTLLVDQEDFASGASRNWSNLFHTEIQHMNHLDMKAYNDMFKQRAILKENAPHLVKQIELILPTYKTGLFTKSFRTKMLDRLTEMAFKEKRKHLTKKELIKREPMLSFKQGKHALLYKEFLLDESRLTIDLVKEAVKRGLLALNYMKVESFIYENDKISGALIVDQNKHVVHKVITKQVVNATGSSVDRLRVQDRSLNHLAIDYVEDHFISVKRDFLPIHHAIYVETDGNQLISFVPYRGTVIIGTSVKKEDRQSIIPFLIDAVNRTFENVHMSQEQLEGSWVVKRPFPIDNKKKYHEFKRSECIESSSGLLSVICSQHTFYRSIAEQIVNRVCKKLQPNVKKVCETDTVTISGGYVGGMDDFQLYKKKRAEEGNQYGLTVEQANELIDRYGSNIGQIYARIRMNGKQAKMFGMSPALFAELVYCIEEEGILSPVDFFIQRTGYLVVNKDFVSAMKEPIFRYMRDRLNWTEEQEERFREKLMVEMTQVYNV
ncbi:FAD-dependent oxidoreductase [Alkalihalobacillus sp. LMS6]|uniref:FAD-dependent oxidoreductase n=1 Tax=Alkalihalobacillus sp. LMS6 TaxID=2924034 RepID=UPI0020D18BF4|nr:FAD-dependent oxidoreductase [Alkalihalobacillus sp. LMS6]UTR07786.1 FAD-dependent oxidoreductase [Alkalihalobacillus sp. LMS6]